MSTTHISGIFLFSLDPTRLARFYEQTMGFSLGFDHAADSNGANGVHHYECDLGNVHFAIHPPRDGSKEKRANNAMTFSINVEDLDACIARIREKGTQLAFEPLDLDFGRLAGVDDPDGNRILLTELK